MCLPIWTRPRTMASATLLQSTFVLPPLLFTLPLNTFFSLPKLHLLPTPPTPFSARNHTPKTPFVTTTSSSWSSETDQESSEDEDYDEDEPEAEDEDEDEVNLNVGHAPPLRSRRRRYRKQYPGENIGITEEMRFIAMKLRNSANPDTGNGEHVDGEENTDSAQTWEPSVEGFFKYLVDSNHVFTTIERIVDESTDVSYVYFRKTGLERAECLSRDLEWFRQEGNSIPEPSNPGITYAKYLEEIAEKSPALFMSHFYNIYFSHIAGGQVIAKKVSKKLIDGRELEFFKWEGNEEELLRGVREKLNMLGEHWSRDEKNKCLREATKSFRFLGQIVRLIIL